MACFCVCYIYLIFRNSYVLEHLLVAALVYSCSRILRPFCNSFECLCEHRDVHFINDKFKDLRKFLKEHLLGKDSPTKLTHFRIHKSQVGLIKLKGFSPLGVYIQKFLFMRKLNYIKLFFPVLRNAIGFVKEANSPFTSCSVDQVFEGQ